MSGDALPFQVIYAGKSDRSLPSKNAPSYHKATEVLKFRIESGGDNHWSTQFTMKTYVQYILVPYLDRKSVV